MTASASRSFVVATSKMPALKKLTTVPLLAWPSIAALALVVIGFCTSSWLALTGMIPLWVACLLNGTVLIWEFTAIHEALHRSLASNVTVNDALGRLGMVFLLPQFLGHYGIAFDPVGDTLGRVLPWAIRTILLLSGNGDSAAEGIDV